MRVRSLAGNEFDVVRGESTVYRRKSQALNLCLCNEKSIERISMVPRERDEGFGMSSAQSEFDEARLLEKQQDLSRGK